MKWLKNLFKKEKNDNILPKEIAYPTDIRTIKSTYQEDTKKILGSYKRRYIPKKRRKWPDIDNEILLLLRYCPVALSTTAIAEKVRINPASAKSHLERLTFDGFVEKHQQGKNKRWCYWKIKR